MALWPCDQSNMLSSFVHNCTIQNESLLWLHENRRAPQLNCSQQAMQPLKNFCTSFAVSVLRLYWSRWFHGVCQTGHSTWFHRACVCVIFLAIICNEAFGQQEEEEPLSPRTSLPIEQNENASDCCRSIDLQSHFCSSPVEHMGAYVGGVCLYVSASPGVRGIFGTPSCC